MLAKRSVLAEQELGSRISPIDLDFRQTSFDPLVALRFTVPFKNDHWRLGLRADLGGFTIGSQYAWPVYPYGGHNFDDIKGKGVFELAAAFRAFGMKYETGSRVSRFVYDMIIRRCASHSTSDRDCVRVPAFAWWPGMIDEGQLVGDIVHVTDLYTTIANLGGVKTREASPMLVPLLHTQGQFHDMLARHELMKTKLSGRAERQRHSADWAGERTH